MTLFESAQNGESLAIIAVIVIILGAIVGTSWRFYSLYKKTSLRMDTPKNTLTSWIGFIFILLNLAIAGMLLFLSLEQIISGFIQLCVAVGTLILAAAAYDSFKISQMNLDEMQKSRKVDYLRAQISKLYCPLINNEKMWINQAPEYHDQTNHFKGYIEFYDLLRENTYLAGPKLRDKLIDFLENESQGGSQASMDRLAPLKKPLIAAAKEEYNDLMKELDDLIGFDKK